MPSEDAGETPQPARVGFGELTSDSHAWGLLERSKGSGEAHGERAHVVLPAHSCEPPFEDSSHSACDTTGSYSPSTNALRSYHAAIDALVSGLDKAVGVKQQVVRDGAARSRPDTPTWGRPPRMTLSTGGTRRRTRPAGSAGQGGDRRWSAATSRPLASQTATLALAVSPGSRRHIMRFSRVRTLAGEGSSSANARARGAQLRHHRSGPQPMAGHVADDEAGARRPRGNTSYQSPPMAASLAGRNTAAMSRALISGRISLGADGPPPAPEPESCYPLPLIEQGTVQSLRRHVSDEIEAPHLGRTERLRASPPRSQPRQASP